MERMVKICASATPGCDCYRCRLDRMERRLQELTELVAEMRHGQKTYFRLRSPSALRDARRLESAVDDWLRRLATPTLFET